MADDAEAIHAAELKKKRQFRKYSYRGIDLEDLLDKSSEEVLPPPSSPLPSLLPPPAELICLVDPPRSCTS